jgi:GT2 family glycosyltransferase
MSRLNGDAAATAQRPRAAADDLVSVVIVNFNARGYLADAVESVLAQTGVSVEIIVVDNKSTDDSLGLLRSRIGDPRVRILELDRNYGFAQGCNRGLAAANGNMILFLNPDCRMRAGSLSRLRWMLDGRPDAGMAGPLILNPDGSEQRGCRRDIPNPWQIFCVAFGLPRLMPRHPRFRHYAHSGVALPDRPTEVPAISGACMLVRRSAIDAVGRLDGEYFLHFEDLDWCLRFDRVGLKILFVPSAVVEHTQGICSASRPLRTEAAKHRSLVRFMRKHFTAYYPSSFMAVVSMLVAIRFFMVALRTAVIRRRPVPGPWERLIRGPSVPPTS